MNWLKRFRRRFVTHPGQLPTRVEVKALEYQYAGIDDRVVALAQGYFLLLNERADVILAERERLTGLLIANRGDYGNDAWSHGYYEATEDAADLVAKGE